MRDFDEATVGPYPFGDEKMGVVETPHLGMEHQTINAYGNGYKIDGRGYDWLLQHEFAHEWFGNQLTNQNADDMWLHEGLGSYMQPLYARWLLGDRYMQRELANQREGLINKYPVVSGTSKTEDEVYKGDVGPGNDIYSKGSLISHSLRMLIGDEAFHEAITRLVYGRPDPQPGNFAPLYRSTGDFLEIVNAVTGQDYGWFFKGYLYNAALPVLKQTRGRAVAAGVDDRRRRGLPHAGRGGDRRRGPGRGDDRRSGRDRGRAGRPRSDRSAEQGAASDGRDRRPAGLQGGSRQTSLTAHPRESGDPVLSHNQRRIER
jgi:hypothetical protein